MSKQSSLKKLDKITVSKGGVNLIGVERLSSRKKKRANLNVMSDNE